MEFTQGRLVIVGAHTSSMQVYFDGKQVVGITALRIDWENEEQRVKLTVKGSDDLTYAALLLAGVHIKKEK